VPDVSREGDAAIVERNEHRRVRLEVPVAAQGNTMFGNVDHLHARRHLHTAGITPAQTRPSRNRKTRELTATAALMAPGESQTGARRGDESHQTT
jgi:hypothetical protein